SVLVEVVHEGAAEERLEGLVHRGQADPLLQHLLAIHLGEELRHARQQGREQPRELGALPRGGQEFVRLLGEERGVLARAIVELVVDRRGAVERGGQRKLDVGIDVALVLLGHEPTWKPKTDETRYGRGGEQQEYREGGLADQEATAVEISAHYPLEDAVEATE